MGCLYIARDIYSDKNTPHILGVVMLYLLVEASAPTAPPLWSPLWLLTLLIAASAVWGWADHLSTPQYPNVSLCLHRLTFWLCVYQGFFIGNSWGLQGKKIALIIFFYLYQHNYIENAKKKKMLVEVNGWTNSSKIPHLSHIVKKWYKCTFP